jgi:DNA-binding HxlR family transcriptional regulator
MRGKKVSKTVAGVKELPNRRSVCPVSCGLDLFGDKWTLLVVRDLICGKTRFKELAESPEGIATNVLSDRLERLIKAGVIEQVLPEDGTKYMAYRLTKKGKALTPIVRGIRDWGLAWEPGTEARMSGGK